MNYFIEGFAPVLALCARRFALSSTFLSRENQDFSIALTNSASSLAARSFDNQEARLNSELCKKALDKIGNPNVLVNLVSRRVRQLNGSGPGSKPLVADSVQYGAADVALIELVEDKMGWEAIQSLEEVDAAPKKRRKSQS